MKESLILGLMVGMVFGAFLTQTCPTIQQAVQKGKDELKKKVEKL